MSHFSGCPSTNASRQRAEGRISYFQRGIYFVGTLSKAPSDVSEEENLIQTKRKWRIRKVMG
jgi:hypothetical protein